MLISTKYQMFSTWQYIYSGDLVVFKAVPILQSFQHEQ